MIKFLPSLKHYFLKLFAYWNVKKVNSSNNFIDNSKTTLKTNDSLTKPNKSTSSTKKDLRINRDRSDYNQKPEVKAKKRADYLAKKEIYYQNKKRKRDLAKENRNKPNESK